MVSSHRSGVPLSVVNGISNPSFGTFDGIKAVIGGHCTPFLSAAILAGLFTIATSTLAPAARKSSVAIILQCEYVMMFPSPLH